ncbi:MAG: sortase [Oscillospiraceae bacterium]|jgi:SrtB family sortase|nr:sortase [Oscillospiraceae bacterium]
MAQVGKLLHLYLGESLPEGDGTARRTLGGREVRRVEEARDFPFELYFALVEADTVVVTGSFPAWRRDAETPLRAVGEAVCLFTGQKVWDGQGDRLEEGGLFLGLSFSVGDRQFYLVPGASDKAARAYAIIERHRDARPVTYEETPPLEALPPEWTEESTQSSDAEAYDDRAAVWRPPEEPEAGHPAPLLQQTEALAPPADAARAVEPLEAALFPPVREAPPTAVAVSEPETLPETDQASAAEAAGKMPGFRKLLVIAACVMVAVAIAGIIYRTLEDWYADDSGSSMSSLYWRGGGPATLMLPLAAASGGGNAVPAAADPGTEPLTEAVPLTILGDFQPLLAENPDVVGWLTVPGTKADGPVLFAPDNYYLTHNFNKESSRSGTLFLDSQDAITGTHTSDNLAIYGHNMKSGAMFGRLKEYQQLSFYRKNPVFVFDTLYERGYWVVFSVFITNAEAAQDNGQFFEWRTADFLSREDKEVFLDDCAARSLFVTGVDVQAGDPLLSLTTCTYEFTEARLVLMARKVRPGETIDVSGAAVNASPLYPQAWYDIHGGSKP